MTELISRAARVDLLTINILLASHRLSRRRIAEEAQVRRVIVTKVLRGHRDVSREKQLAVLQTIARLTGCDIGSLVMGRLAA
jgi:hypothetical protein